MRLGCIEISKHLCKMSFDGHEVAESWPAWARISADGFGLPMAIMKSKHPSEKSPEFKLGGHYDQGLAQPFTKPMSIESHADIELLSSQRNMAGMGISRPWRGKNKLITGRIGKPSCLNHVSTFSKTGSRENLTHFSSYLFSTSSLWVKASPIFRPT